MLEASLILAKVSTKSSEYVYPRCPFSCPDALAGMSLCLELMPRSSSCPASLPYGIAHFLNRTVVQLMERTVSHGESNSLLVLGGSGHGKTAVCLERP